MPSIAQVRYMPSATAPPKILQKRLSGSNLQPTKLTRRHSCSSVICIKMVWAFSKILSPH
jgi:hypothetical protein